QQCLTVAQNVWEEEQKREPATFRHGNTTGGNLTDEEFKATVELLITTGDQKYADGINSIWPEVAERFPFNVAMSIAAIPHMDGSYKERVKESAKEYKKRSDGLETLNPFGVPIS